MRVAKRNDVAIFYFQGSVNFYKSTATIAEILKVVPAIGHIILDNHMSLTVFSVLYSNVIIV